MFEQLYTNTVDTTEMMRNTRFKSAPLVVNQTVTNDDTGSITPDKIVTLMIAETIGP